MLTKRMDHQPTGCRARGHGRRLRGVMLLVVAAIGILPAPAQAMPLASRTTVGAITVSIGTHPAPLENVRSAAFGWHTSGIIGETRCKVDAAPYDYCPGNPARYYGLADGRHTFTVRVRNGYQQVSTDSYSWTVDTVDPQPPTVTGGSLTWSDHPFETLSAAGGTDAGTGVEGYEHRANSGAGWSAPARGATATVRTEGTTVVQFRTVDRAGNVSTWAPATSGPADTVRLDRTPPTAPTATGGSLTWQTVA